MKRRPVILVAPSLAQKGEEFADESISVSNRYTDALIAGGGLPQIFPATTSRAVIAEAVRRSDGVLLTGGEDIAPRIYGPEFSDEIVALAGPAEPERDLWEPPLIAEALAQKKPLFGICRGHQILNVALGGTLVVDIATQLPGTLNHRQMERKSEPVHEIHALPDSLLAKLMGRETFAVNSTHHQAIARVAEPLRVAAQSDDGVVEALELKDPAAGPFLLSVQFHPERLIENNPLFGQLFNGFVDACARAREENL
jgi:putative glutamine amidotransferase